MELEFSQNISEKYSNIKFPENPSSGSRVFPCGRADGQTDRADMTKLMVAFRKFSNAPKNEYSSCIEAMTFLDQRGHLARIKCKFTLMLASTFGTGMWIY
jgi:hypothetical protein